jgi:hypothetical protein
MQLHQPAATSSFIEKDKTEAAASPLLQRRGLNTHFRRFHSPWQYTYDLLELDVVGTRDSIRLAQRFRRTLRAGERHRTRGDNDDTEYKSSHFSFLRLSFT